MSSLPYVALHAAEAHTGLAPALPSRRELPASELLERAQHLAQRFTLQAASHDASGAPPANQIQALFDADLLRLTIARRDGGHGAGLSLARRVVQLIAQGDPSVALILSMHYSQHAGIARSRREPDPAARGWPDALATRVTRDALRAPALINAIQVEPELGSPSHGGIPATTARRVGDNWQLDGHKLYSTGSTLLSWLSVLAVTDEPTPRIGNFLVPRGTPGVRIVETWDPLGMRATASHDVVLENVRIPLDHAAGLYDTSLGLRRDIHTQAWYFSLIGAVYTGAAEAARDWLAVFLNQRRPTTLAGAALASLPTMQDSIGQIHLLLAASNALLDSHASQHDAGQDNPELAVAMRYFSIENAAKATALALELAGNHGVSRHNPLERHYRNAQSGQIHAPSAALLRGNAGRAVLQSALDA